MSFTELYKKNKRVFSFEFFPPKRPEDLPATKALIARMSALQPDFMTVTYGAGGGTRARTQELVSYIVNELKCPAAAHLTCVHHTVEEVERMLDSFAADGINKIVALRGDPSNTLEGAGSLFPGFSCARDLVRYVKSKGSFHMAVAAYPEVHPDAKSSLEDLLYLKEKVDAGAELILTQVFFDPEIYFAFVKEAQRVGIQVPIVPGILPIGNLKQLEIFTSKCGATIPNRLQDDLRMIGNDRVAVQAFGTSYAARMCEKLLEGGAPGIHFYTLNKSMQVEEVIKVLRGALPN
ncbi:MAG: methylenetetrahydrofolate reductase [NAD(P)H] [SAR324 cluster bacterium]|uniref:Methylenetetrahydrofolate reductase n=1 Tax=SAR324 cluster bacterium TaxID=2024889 RepID=A0A7X9ILA4_9DELT|nr:methylenetetrahydrofolate reductase [NAD(P)H] [SAR324 cluster bacterium]